MNPEKILETIFVVQYTPSSTATSLLIQGESDLVSLLRQLITLAYVDYINYPFNHLILYMGDFVWHIECIDVWPHAVKNCLFSFSHDL